MHDFNFFEPYLTRGRQQESASSFKYDLLIIFLLIALTAWPAYNLVRGFQLKRETASLKAEVVTNEKYALLDESKSLDQYVKKLQEQLKSVSDVDTNLKGSVWLNEPFLFSLLSTVPKDVQVEDFLVYSDKLVEISGVASNKPAIAEFERNLRETDRFESLYVESMSNENGTYNFKMGFQLKGVDTNAAN